jgi:hypothetical protein
MFVHLLVTECLVKMHGESNIKFKSFQNILAIYTSISTNSVSTHSILLPMIFD